MIYPKLNISIFYQNSLCATCSKRIYENLYCMGKCTSGCACSRVSITLTKLLCGMHNFFIKILYKLIANFAKSKRSWNGIWFAIDRANLNPNRLSICRECKLLPCIYYVGSKFWMCFRVTHFVKKWQPCNSLL